MIRTHPQPAELRYMSFVIWTSLYDETQSRSEGSVEALTGGLIVATSFSHTLIPHPSLSTHHLRPSSLHSQNSTPPKEAPAATSSDLAPMFGQMLELMREQNKMMAEQGKTLKEHSTMLETLKTDALKNDQPFEKRSLKDRLTWGILRKEAVAKAKEKVDEWKDLMQLSLVFNAIFLTVVTAFIAPVIQAFAATPTNSASGSSSKPSLPPLTTQFVALFFYLALIVSILNAVLCVLGMQWASRLLAIPLGKDDLERTLAHEKRRALAEGKLLPLMGVLFWTLLLSIGFFIVGLLIQVWALSFSCSSPSFVLVVAAAISTGLSVIILGVILSTTYHAAITDNSPFESPLSAAMRPALQWFRSHIQRKDAPKTSVKDEGAPETPKKSVDELIRTEETDSDSVKALKTYARLVLNTTDAEVLERTVPSFEIVEWYSAGDTLWDVFSAVRERFLATDTSFRVKETVHKQVVYCREWSGWTDEYGRWRSDLEGNAITRWCRDQCKDLVDRSHESHRQFFPAFVFFTSLDPHNKDLRGYPWEQSYEESVARVLSSFDQNGELGDRWDVFYSAVIECSSLLEDDRLVDVTRILSSGDRSSILRSLLRNPWYVWDGIKDIVALITGGNEIAVLEEMAEFFSNLPDIKPVDDDLLVIHFLESLIPSLPPTFTVPQSFNLIPTLTLLLRYQSRIEDSLLRYSDTLLYFLDHGGLKQLSSLRPAHDFFQLCLTQSSNDQLDTVSDRARFYLSEHHEAFTPLPGPSDQELEDLVNALVAYKESMSSQHLQESFVDAALGCDCLIREQKKNEVQGILLRVGYLPILEAFIRDPRLRLKHISSLVLLTKEEEEHTYLRDLSPAITDPSLSDHPDACQRIIELLAFLLQHLPSDFTVPREFDLSQTFSLFMRTWPDRDTWRKFSDTLIQYLDHGALEALSDNSSVQPFLDLCVQPSLEMMLDWDREQRTSNSTSKRAAELRKKLHELDAAQSSPEGTRLDDGANPPESMNEIREPHRTVMPRVWQAFVSGLGGLVRLQRNERKARGGDLELALQYPSGS
ncbi:hypothetical protein SISSUDRAFT_1133257 [Sistotremastrum suecicum HHB10207 ss-3]|uniref:DUF6535 domain-containing protein n=1 Tax=Sistotremastrum suecicum HHB10207 ss-3 TaxID=1314776 RepID=A0A165XK19_9AGAM|nr:hypothetical protein SISSUDRAFT_1133257 [Sistotremastrum suecicum HHB10207 ss-3]